LRIPAAGFFGVVAGLLVGWLLFGPLAISFIVRVAIRVAERLDGVGDRAPPAGLAFALVLGCLSWSALWAAAGAGLVRILAAARAVRRQRVP